MLGLGSHGYGRQRCDAVFFATVRRKGGRTEGTVVRYLGGSDAVAGAVNYSARLNL